jgi:heparosan-N-sulfate-glucuronate 5-epimerase
MLNYHGRLGVQYNPNAIAQQALGYYDLMAEEPFNPKHSQSLLRQSRWFLTHGRRVSDSVLLWEYCFPWEGRRFLESPWRSALAQGQAISVLLRAYQVSGDAAYLDAATRGYKAFHYESLLHEGGVVSRDNGYTWLEEVVHDPPNHILNGFIWALWGVRDYASFFNDRHATKLYHDCLQTLEANLHRYDLGFWTCYDLVDHYPRGEPIMPASLYYQDLHTTQMLACFNLTGRKIFLNYHLRWKRYLRSFWRRAVSQTWKCYFKLRHF